MVRSSSGSALRRPSSSTSRSIVFRTAGHGQGPITRLVSPGDVGELIKPFVFLDAASLDGASTRRTGFGWHPHSGIATVTVMIEGSITYTDSTGAQGVLAAGAVEWFQAGGGAWHTGQNREPARAYQLWLALPPELETAPAMSRYLGPEHFPRRGPVRVILGQWLGVQSPVPAPSSVALLDVVLKAGDVWRYDPPQGHDVAWLTVHAGRLLASEPVAAGELVVFEEDEASLVVQATEDVRFILGSASKHPYDLVLGHYSVHTSAEALAAGESTYRRIGEELRRAGKLQHP